MLVDVPSDAFELEGVADTEKRTVTARAITVLNFMVLYVWCYAVLK